MEYFTVGEQIELREVFRGKTWTSRPVTVVQDNDSETVLRLAAGTVTRYPSGPQHGTHTVKAWLEGDWTLTDRVWTGNDVLRISRPGWAFDVWVSDPGTAGPGWYVNLQEPLRRTASGFETMDHVLDITVTSDLSSWAWKDEAEFALAVELGVFTQEQAAEIRQVGEHLIELIEAGTPPWDVKWGK